MDGLLAELKITTHTLKTKSILGSFDRGQHLPEGHTTDMESYEPFLHLHI